MSRATTPGARALQALDAGIDGLFTDDAPEAGADEGLLDVARRLAALSDAVWEEVVPLYQAPTRWQRFRAAASVRPVLSVAAALVLVAVFVGIGLLATRAPQGRPAAPAAPAAWRLAGYIDQAAWTQGASAGGLGAPLLVTCPGASTCYAVQPGSPVVEVTTDGGAAWTASTVPGGAPVTAAPSCPGLRSCMVATGGPALVATSDGGSSWSARPVPAAVTNLACTSSTDCVALGHDPAAPAGPALALRTTDAGTTWDVTTVSAHFIPDVRDGLRCSAAGDCVVAGVVPGSPSAGAIWYSTDVGASWSPASLPAGVQVVRAVACPDAVHCVAVANGATTAPGAPYGPSEALTSADGGRSWTVAGRVLAGSVTVGSLSCPAPGHCWAGGHRQRSSTAPAGLIAVTNDGGTTWTAAELPPGVELVADLSCPPSGACVAIGSASTNGSAERPVVLRSPG